MPTLDEQISVAESRIQLITEGLNSLGEIDVKLKFSTPAHGGFRKLILVLESLKEELDELQLQKSEADEAKP